MENISSDAWAGLIGVAVGTLLSFGLEQLRASRKRKQLAGGLGKLFTTEVKRITLWLEAQQGSPYLGPWNLPPSHRIGDEHGHKIFEVLDADTANELARFYYEFHEFLVARERITSEYGFKGIEEADDRVRKVFDERRGAALKTAKSVLPKLIHAGC